jgi:hypothetical protein
MAITTNMSDYKTASIEAEYGDEVMCAGWCPDVGLACQHLSPEPSDTHMAMPADLATEVPESFLQRMYSYQE